jgi:signal transduction histidine kinase
VLTLGFGGLLLCILAAGIGTTMALDRVRGDETLTRKTFLERTAALDQIRAKIYLSGTYVRDFLLSPDPRGAAAESARLAGLERETREALEAYARALEPEEKESFQALRREIDSYWQVADRALDWTPEQRLRLRYSFFYDELIPRRTTMLQIADRVAAVHEKGLERAEERLTALADGLRRRLLVTFGITFVGGALLALLTIGFTLRLERELERGLEENARARSGLQELSAQLVRAQENERRTLARELHDGVGQSLSAIVMETHSAESADRSSEVRDRLASIRAIAEKTVNEVRDLALLLRPSMLDDFGLVPALAWHCREMSKRTGLKVLVRAEEAADDLPEDHKTCIYRLVQEAVNNAARHASARTVEVVVGQGEESVLLRVQDDGAGFDTKFVRGLGLLGMEERVRRLGGSFGIDSRPGRGTVVTAELPVARLAKREHAHSNSGS